MKNTIENYAARFIGLKEPPAEDPLHPIDFMALVGFARQLRDGCHQDLQRLIVKCIEDTPSKDGKEALRFLGCAITEESTELWGLPDCNCNKASCVYCGRGLSVPPAKELT